MFVRGMVDYTDVWFVCWLVGLVVGWLLEGWMIRKMIGLFDGWLAG